MEEGFVEYYSLPNEEMSIVLERPEYVDYYLEHHPEFKDYLKHFITYVNMEKSVIVEIYDTRFGFFLLVHSKFTKVGEIR